MIFLLATIKLFSLLLPLHTPFSFKSHVLFVASMTDPCTCLQLKFAKATNECFQQLEQDGIQFQQVRSFITSIYSTKDTGIQERQIDELLDNDEDLDDIFTTLSQHGLWDYQNYLLLKKIVMQFLSENAQIQAVLRQYEKEITCYQTSTTILHACELHLVENENSPPKHMFEELNVKFGVTSENMHLNYITDLSISLARRFELVPEALLLKKFTQQPLIVKWLVPTLFCKRISDQSQIPSNAKWLEEKKVLYMAFGTCVFYHQVGEKVCYCN